MTPLEDRIADRYADLSPQERRAADTLLDHLGDLATYRATELATLAGVSKATMSRLFRRLGYEDFEGLREHLRMQRGRGLPVAVEPGPGLRERLEQEIANLHRAYGTLSEELLDDVAGAIADARQVVVVGRRGSHPVAVELRRNLAQARSGVVFAPAPGQSLAEDLVGLGPSDVVVMLSFRRHATGVVPAVEQLLADGVRVLLLADPTLRVLSGRVTWWVECPVGYEGAFDSHAVPMSLVAALSDAVLARVPAGEQRIEAIDRAYAALHEIEES